MVEVVLAQRREMVSTWNREKAGTTEYAARARMLIPLADPDAYGNDGLQGFDEDCVGERFPSKAAAVRWLKAKMKTEAHMASAEVCEVFWEPDDFTDDKYGLVLDAIETERHYWYFFVDRDKRVLESDGDWKP
jgi:hypothetical protein